MHVDGEWARGVLDKSGVSLKVFADRVGVKENSARCALSIGRLSKRMREELHQMANDQTVEELVREAVAEEPEPEPEPAEGSERLAVVYCVPRNPHIRLAEFRDGSHGRFRCKPGDHLMGSRVRLKWVSGDLWERVGEYDGRGRLLE